MTLITTPITTSTVIPAGSIVVVEIFAPDEGTTPNMRYFPGFNLAGENNTPWIKSNGCGIAWSDANGITTDPQPYVINLVGQNATASIEDNLNTIIEIYPNPINSKLFINLPSDTTLKKATLYNLLGKDTGVKLLNNSMHTEKLASGIYLLKIETNLGTVLKKIIKD